METDFKGATEKQELSQFELAKALYEKVRYSNPMLAFGVTRELVVPHLKALGTDEALSEVLKALDPATENIDLEDRIQLPFIRETDRTLRNLVFPEAKHYAETGSESNKQLARILNSLSGFDRVDPIEAMRRSATGEKVLHLPVHPDVAHDDKMRKERLQRGQDFKKEAYSAFVSDLHRLLYDGTQSIGSSLQYALHRMPTTLIDGIKSEKALRKVINDFGDVGAMVREGYGVAAAVDVIKRTNDMRAQRALKKEIS